MLALFFAMGSCSPRAYSSLEHQYPILSYTEDIIVYEIEDKLPENLEILGTSKLRDSGFSTKCNREAMIDAAKLEARRVGGNYIQIIKDKKPNFWYSCHRLDIIILRRLD